jgi:hypothetical protein
MTALTRRQIMQGLLWASVAANIAAAAALVTIQHYGQGALSFTVAALVLWADDRVDRLLTALRDLARDARMREASRSYWPDRPNH